MIIFKANGDQFMIQLIVNSFVKKEKPDNYCWKGIDF